MKKIVMTLFILVSFSNVIYAHDFKAAGFQFPLLFPLSTTPLSNLTMPDLTPMAAEYNPKNPESFFGALGAGFLNIFFGLGQFLIYDEWQVGTFLAVWQGLGFIGAVAFGWEDLMAGTFFNGWDGARWNGAKLGLMIGGGLGLATGILSPLAGGGFESILLTPLFILVGGMLGGIIGFCVEPGGIEYTSPENMKWAMFSVGFYLFGAIVLGIPTPVATYFQIKAEQKKTAQLSDLRNWNIGIVPTADGRLAGHIGFTVHL